MEIRLPADVIKIIDILQEAGYSAYAVGGAVRDVLIGRTPGDFDITTSAKPEEVKALFRHTVDTGIQHGTVTVMLHRVGYEVTTYRLDGDYTDSRHPEKVTFTPELSEDLRRRDFTINAMAYNDADGLVDLYGGQEDLAAGVIRAVGEPAERFQEDALRILRCIRFAAQLGFRIEENTFSAAQRLAPTLTKISAERIREEVIKILLSDHPDYVGILHDIGALEPFYPEFGHGRDHMLRVLNDTPKDRIYRLCAFLHASGSVLSESLEIAERVLTALKFDNDTKNQTLKMIRYHMTPMLSDAVSVRKLMAAYGKDEIDRLITYIECDHQTDHSDVRETVRQIRERGDCTSLRELAVSGNDLVELGMHPGKEIGAVLQNLLEQVLNDPEKNRKEILLSIVRMK